ncbi:UDP-N-acetylmuramoyl-tripeptide--D-alanyl-D-alanine ligase [Thermodesulfitimonas autotrophica]|uniref:UDP-N-acetylmuramoyl-tripeptide--D-alanyl-D-alanine ligase n=1 Tax=Thermodesulfitimonas autotrophica TaxID=1894989 RepID=A0A3N5APJ7_9THEO|nr:UDP-N-acetylmuramoyl-tripeptide--D-alanyl-D-alanine ligase [Thermodesulfitimonas autotrophica]RPF46784.1 UDP-N-acetylmuramoyl-tripeptide--D-alanyl-D-alanine ligase [Thermodesulfitimonas autotrophica]
MIPVTVAELAAALNASLLQGEPNRRVAAVTTDSRQVPPGAVFFALKGERYDGHDFVPDAVAKGAAGVVVSRPVAALPGETVVLLVPNVLAALGAFARYVRRQAGVLVIGVTGSTGKTSTKDIIAAVLGVRYRVCATQGNLNNEIGVPLTLLSLSPGDEVAVVEMAMRGAGEIAALARIAAPDAAVITNIGETHLERLGSVAAIAAAKGEILDYIPAAGFAVLHAESPYIFEQAKRCRGRVIFFGTSGAATIRLTDYGPVGGGGRFAVAAGGLVTEYFIPLPGYHSALNAVAAIGVARELGLGPEEIQQGLERVRLTGMRLEIRECGTLLVINDAYNANPASMRAALGVLKEVGKKRRRVAVLGDMLELGSRAAAAHREIGAAAAAVADVVVAVGELAQGIAEGALAAGLSPRQVVTCPDAAAAVAVLKELLRGDEAVLVKASRGMRLERVAEALCTGGEAAQ